MMRSRVISHRGRRVLLLALLWGLGASPTTRAQPAAAQAAPGSVTQPRRGVRAPAALAVGPAPVAPASNWPWMLGLLLGGIALGVLGARWYGRGGRWARNGPTPNNPTPPVATPAPAQKKPAENVVVRPPVVQSLREVQGSAPASTPALPRLPSWVAPAGGRPGANPQNNSPSRQVSPWPANVPHRPAAMNPPQPPPPPPPSSPNPTAKPLETGQTIEWAAPAASSPVVRESIAGREPAAPGEPLPDAPVISEVVAPVTSVAGPVHYYAPAPDVPSIEHRKLSPNPLPQMPLLIILPQAEATTAQYSFSPQANQSRIIGNGVRELKEFFQFELPPTEQFTAIQNLAPGKLEKRDDVWHVVQKAEIGLS